MAEKRLKASIIIGGLMDGSLRSAMSGTQSGFRRIGDAISGARKHASRLNEEIKALDSSGGSVEKLKLKYDTLAKAISRAEDAQKRLRSSEARSARIGEIGSGLRSRAVGVGATGALFSPMTISGVREAQKMEQQTAQIGALGVGEDVTRSAVGFARTVKQYGTSQVAAVEMMRDALSVFGSLTEAKIALPILERVRFANSSVYGHEKGEEATKNFVDMTRVIDNRGGGNDSASFKRQADFIQQVYSVSGGRIVPKEWLDLSTHASIAGKSMSDAAFYYQNMPLINDMGSGAKVGTGLRNIYSHVVQGSNTVREVRAMERYHLIGDVSKVQHDKVGQVSHINPGALIGSQLLGYGKNSVFDPYQWMKKYLLPTLAKQGITGRSEVLAAIGSILGGGTGGGLMATMFTNQSNIDRDTKMASQAKTVDQSYDAAKQTSGGKQAGLRAGIDDARLALGEKLLGPYKHALDMANNALDKFNIFTARHPRLARNMALGIGAITVGMLLAAPAMVVAGSALNAYSGFALLAARREAKLTTAMLENAAAVEADTVATLEASAASRTSLFSFAGWKSVGRSVGAALMFLPRSIWNMGKATVGSVRSAGLLKTAWAPMGGIFRGLGVAIGALFSPIGVLGLVLGAAALLVYKYWQPISTFFQGVWKGIQEGLRPLGPSVTAAFSPIVNVVKSVWGWFTNLLQPVHLTKDGVEKATASGEAFGKIVGGAIKSVVGWLEKAVGYFSWIGEHGASIFNSVSSKASTIFGHLIGSDEDPSELNRSSIFKPPPQPQYADSPELPALSNDNRKASTHHHVHHHTYQITQQPGESSDELADRIHRKQAASQRMRTPLYDGPD
ncbi:MULTISPECIES: phage tail tape measure protein [Asaia]|uniref:hypothetical protein n=1 Tax=Asaia TaxID=91914 RepID=UPI002FC2C086